MVAEVETRSIARLETPDVLADRVYEGVRNAIFSLELPPGAAVVERDLASRFGISKSPVRDALQRLVGQGLLEQSPRRALRVLMIDRQLADEIYELRETLESLAVRLATPHLTVESVGQAHDILNRSATASKHGETAETARLNREFHEIFSSLSGNRALARALSQLQDRVRLIVVLGWRSRPSMIEEHSQHLAVLRAAEARDADAAAQLMFSHVHASRIRLRETLPDQVERQ